MLLPGASLVQRWRELANSNEARANICPRPTEPAGKNQSHRRGVRHYELLTGLLFFVLHTFHLARIAATAAILFASGLVAFAAGRVLTSFHFT
jgi:hypothetical protein